MIITNKYNLPAPIVAAVTNDSYTKGDADYSVTELLNPPQISRLRKQYEDQMEEDVSERIWSLLGSSVHHMIERAADDVESLSEVTLNTMVEGKKIKGTFDHVCLSQGELYDFKVTSVRKVQNDVVPVEWVQQTNVYRYMMWKEKGIETQSIYVIAILRDWLHSQAKRDAAYPPVQIRKLAVPVWDYARTAEFLRERVQLHEAQHSRECTQEERWESKTVFAIARVGRKTALKLCDTREEAEYLMKEYGGTHIDVRPGRAIRCEDWCPVSQWCPQWAADPRRPAPNLVESMFNG